MQFDVGWNTLTGYAMVRGLPKYCVGDSQALNLNSGQFDLMRARWHNITGPDCHQHDKMLTPSGGYSFRHSAGDSVNRAALCS
jgi:hypothetical protein